MRSVRWTVAALVSVSGALALPATDDIVVALGLVCVVTAIVVLHRRHHTHVVEEQRAQARHRARMILPGLGRPSTDECAAFATRFWSGDDGERLPAARRPGAQFCWGVILERDLLVIECDDGTIAREYAGLIGWREADGTIRLAPIGDGHCRQMGEVFVVVVSRDGQHSVHDRRPDIPAELSGALVIGAIDDGQFERRARDATKTGWVLGCRSGLEATLLPLPDCSRWTVHWEARDRPETRYAPEEHDDIAAAVDSVVAVAACRRVLQPLPPVRPPPPPTVRAAPAPTAPPAPPPPPRQDVLRLDMGRVDSRNTVGFLIVLSGRRHGDVIRIVGPSMLIGRSPDCDIPFPDETGVSRRHAKLEVLEESCRLIDVGSTGGLFVNNKRVGEKILEEGDVFMLGSGCYVKFTREVVAPAGDRVLLDS